MNIPRITFLVTPAAPVAKPQDKPRERPRHEKQQKAKPVYDPKDLIPWKKRTGKQCKACSDDRPPGYADCYVALANHVRNRFDGKSHGEVCSNCAMSWDRWG